MAQYLPTEIVAGIVRYLPVEHLATCSLVSHQLRELVGREIRARCRYAFSAPGPFKYIFELSQPSDSMSGHLLEYHEAGDTLAELTQVQFDFPERIERCLGHLTIEAGTFTQLGVIGTIVEPRSNGRSGLDGVIPHLEHHFRVKSENFGEVGARHTLNIAPRSQLRCDLVGAEPDGSDLATELYTIELKSILLDPWALLSRIESHIERSRQSTSLIFRGLGNVQLERVVI